MVGGEEDVERRGGVGWVGGVCLDMGVVYGRVSALCVVWCCGVCLG